MPSPAKCLALLSLLLCAPLPAAETLEQIIYREDPSFNPASARLSVGRDGKVYLTSPSNSRCFVLRFDRDGKNRYGTPVGYAVNNATANAAGVIATADAHFSHKVSLYSPRGEPVASLDDFLNNDAVGYASPAHVEAGVSGDFYGLDLNRDRIVRLDPAGKMLRAYPIPRLPAGPQGQAYEFRVDEKRETFLVLPIGGPLFSVGFDGKLRWTLDKKLDDGVRWGYTGGNGGFDISSTGEIYLLGPAGKEVRVLDAAGKLVRTIALAGLPTARPGTALRVHGGDLVIRRRHPTELFLTCDAATGKFRRAVGPRNERLAVTLGDRSVTAGADVPLKIALESDGKPVALPPTWRVWIRPLDGSTFRELRRTADRLEIPKDLTGVCVLRVSPEVRPWRGGTQPDYLIQTWIVIREPGASGTLSIWTADRRSIYARGEEIAPRLLLRDKATKDVTDITLRLVEADTGKVVAEDAVRLTPNVAQSSPPLRITRALAPGRYLLTVKLPGRTVCPQPITIGREFADREPAAWFVQYGDYQETYPSASAWDMPVVARQAVSRAERLGTNLFVDRLGVALQNGALDARRGKEEFRDLLSSLDKDLGGVAPEKVTPPFAISPLLGGYSAAGIRQMAILMYNDAGLPLGSGFDPRKPPELDTSIRRVESALDPFPAFRGWSWASNWWVFDQRGSGAATSPGEKLAYDKTVAEAKKSGKWDPVLDRVSRRRFLLARDAQERFRGVLGKPTWKRVTASAAPYRNVESYPPLSLANVDEVDLQAQWEQIALPYATAHGVDFYRRPGKAAWTHPEIWNDAGTGEQIVPTLFQGLMRGATGVGSSGPTPPWAPRPVDPRSGHAGTASVFLAMGNLMSRYGPWLSRLENADRVAIVVSGRMLAIDDWPNVYGTHFARLLEAYCACLHAHHPATFVFAEDKPDLRAFRAVLVVGQTVELDPALADALAVAREAGVKVFHDGTCRADLMKESTPLKIAFDQFEKDRHPAADDSAYARFPRYCLKHVGPLQTALDPVAKRVAILDNPEVFVSERKSGKGRFVFVVNNTTPAIDPGRMWRVSLLCASRVPTVVDIDLDAGHVYDVFAGKKVLPIKGIVRADCRDLHGRLFAVLPAAIHGVGLETKGTRQGGSVLRVTADVRDEKGGVIPAGLPVRVSLRADGGTTFEERSLATSEAGSLTCSLQLPLVTKDTRMRVDVVELLTGRSASQSFDVKGVVGPVGFARLAPALPGTEKAVAETKIDSPKAQPLDQSFGPHLRDVAVSADGERAYLNAFNWDHNLYALDLSNGKTAWRQRLGHYFAFAPQATRGGVAVQGFDLSTSQGYHLYDVRADGKAARRFALYGLPGRLPHRFVPSMLGDRINNFAAAPSGAWFAGAGNLGVAVWSRDGKLLWQRDWWQTSRRTPFLAALGEDALLLVEGLTAKAVSAKDGKPLWSVTLGASGGVQQVRVSGDGKTVAIRCDGDGGEILLVRNGEVRHRIRALADDMAISPLGRFLAVVRGSQLAWYEDGDLQWVLPGDDKLQHPRIRPDGKRVACCGETGTVYVIGSDGEPRLERDFGQLAVPAWLPKGDLLLAGWMGKVERLAPDGEARWGVVLRPDAEDIRGKLLAPDTTPSARVDFRGNAEAKAWDVKDNLLAPKTCRIEFVSSQTHVQLARPSESLVAGKSSPHAEPWLDWADVGGFAEGVVSNSLQIDTFNRQLRVEAITLVEDPHHPESWLRDVRLEYWEPAAQAWRNAGTLVSDAASHTHRLSTPREAARWRLVPSDLSGNLRLAQITLHGKDLGPSHPDVMAKRPVAVLFDESDELKHAGLVGLPGITFAFGDAHSGGRFLHVAPDAKAYPPWRPPFGHVLPGWDFSIAEKPGPGEYRYLRFAYKALSAKTTGLTLRLDGESYGRAVSVSAGVMPKEDDAVAKKIAHKPATEWTVVEVDLWEVLKKPVRIRGLRLESRGGAAGFDRVLLGRTLEDLRQKAKR